MTTRPSADWTRSLHTLHDRVAARIREESATLDACFSADDARFLATIGLAPIHLYDFAEDLVKSGEPDWDTFLLVAAVRREYFLFEQQGRPCERVTNSEDLPGRRETLGGIEWLPRILVKARCFLEGGLCRDIMYCCGGDRNFLRRHDIHPADFLRVVWRAQGDDSLVLEFVRRTPERLSA